MFRVGNHFFGLGSCEKVLYGRMTERGEGVADEKEDEAPGEEISGDEEEVGDDE